MSNQFPSKKDIQETIALSIESGKDIMEVVCHNVINKLNLAVNDPDIQLGVCVTINELNKLIFDWYKLDSLKGLPSAKWYLENNIKNKNTSPDCKSVVALYAANFQKPLTDEQEWAIIKDVLAGFKVEPDAYYDPVLWIDTDRTFIFDRVLLVAICFNINIDLMGK